MTPGIPFSLLQPLASPPLRTEMSRQRTIRLLLGAATLLLVCPAARAQFTSVTAQVLDPSGNVYVSCHASAAFVPAPTATTKALISGSVFATDVPLAQCDSNGNASWTPVDNNQVSDGHSGAASQLNLAVTWKDGKTGFQCKVTITGASQVITAALKACSAPLPVVSQPASLTANNTFTGNNTLTAGQNSFAGFNFDNTVIVDANIATTPKFATVQAGLNGASGCLSLSFCGDVFLPAAGAYSQSTGPLNFSAAANQWVRLRGASMDATTGSILRFTGASDGLQLNGSATAEDLDIDTSNAGGGIGMRLSGLNQKIKNIRVTNSGSGLWSVGSQALGSVNTSYENVYTSATCCTTGIEVTQNGAAAAGNVLYFNPDARGVTTAFHNTSSHGAMSLVIWGGQIFGGNSHGISDDSVGGMFTTNGTFFQGNGTTVNDISITKTGAVSVVNILNTLHSGGSTNLVNCPNTTCTARVVINGLTTTNAAAFLILGNTTANGSSVMNSTFAGSKYTNGTSQISSRVHSWANVSLDGTVIPDVVADDGSGTARLFFQPSTAPGNQGIFQADGTNVKVFNAGVLGFQLDGTANAKAPVSLAVGAGSAMTSSGAGGTMAAVIASGTATMTTVSIPGGSCGTTVTVSATGVAATDAISWSFSAAVGINPGELNVVQWPTANNVNFAYCNETGGPVIPNAATLNWRVIR